MKANLFSVETIITNIQVIDQQRQQAEREITINRLELERLAANIYRAPKVVASTKINERNS